MAPIGANGTHLGTVRYSNHFAPIEVGVVRNGEEW